SNGISSSWPNCSAGGSKLSPGIGSSAEGGDLERRSTRTSRSESGKGRGEMSERTGTYGAVPADDGSTAPGRGKTIVGGAIGHFIEWYDWSIYGFLASIFAGQMFPAGNPTVSLILAYS